MHDSRLVKKKQAQEHAAKADRYLTISLVAGAIAWLLSLCSCSAPQIAPRFVQPSTSAIQEGHVKAISSVQSAKKRAEDLEAANPALKLQIEPLKVDLDNALSALDTSEGARKALDEQLKQETTKANNLADNFDKAGAQIVSLKASRHRWVKFLIYSMLLNVATIGWIFRKPIFKAARMALGSPI